MELVNGDFSKEWSGSHEVWIFRPGEPPSLQEVGNIFSPDGWVSWFIHEPGIWDQPEVTDAWEHVDPRRVRSSPKALKLFTFGRNHDAGLFQTVEVKVGSRVKFSAYGQAWSNHKDKAHPENFPHPDDGLWSEGSLVGYNEVALRKVPALNGDPQNDANGNIKFQLGIDPTGGNDPRRDCVVWGEPIWSYNAYHEIPPVEIIAQAPTITVFLRSTTLWPFKHNDIYWDDCFLSVTTQEPECENPARVPYDRTYVLLPPDITLSEVHDALDKHFHDRRTIGFSADDAGVGCKLGIRKVIAVRPGSWPSDLKAFFDTYYPGIIYEVEDGEPPPSTTLLSQRDPRWRDIRFGAANCNLTIGQSGCFITCLAMALRYYKKDTLATPVTVDQTLTPSGYTGCRPYWSWIENKLGLELSSPVNVDTWLDQGYCAMAEVRPTSLEHFVLVTKHEGTAYWMLDPLSGAEGWLDETYDGVESWRLILPANEPPAPSGPNVISLHWQKRVKDDIEYVQAVQPGVAKTVLNIEFCKEFKRVSPNTLTVFRQWRPDQGEFIKYANGPRRWLETFLDALHANADVVDYVESLNEMIATDDIDGIKRITEFDAQFCEELRKEGFPARPLVLNAAVGNPQHGAQEELMIPAVQAAIGAGGALGPHTYWGSRPDGYCTMTDAFQHYSGRPMLSWDIVFEAHGLRPNYIFGEGGAVHISPDGWLNPNAGWKDACWNWEHYVQQILEFKRRVDLWNREHGNRVLGFTAFTLGGGSQWGTFDLNGYLDKLAQAVTE